MFSMAKFMHSCCENVSRRAHFRVGCDKAEGVTASVISKRAAADGNSSGCQEVSAISLFHVLLCKTPEE